MKQITVRVDEATYKAAKIKAITLDKHFTQYVVGLIKKDIEKTDK